MYFKTKNHFFKFHSLFNNYKGTINMNKLNNFIIIATCLLLFLSNNNQLFAGGGKETQQWQPAEHKNIMRTALEVETENPKAAIELILKDVAEQYILLK